MTRLRAEVIVLLVLASTPAPGEGKGGGRSGGRTRGSGGLFGSEREPVQPTWLGTSLGKKQIFFFQCKIVVYSSTLNLNFITNFSTLCLYNGTLPSTLCLYNGTLPSRIIEK